MNKLIPILIVLAILPAASAHQIPLSYSTLSISDEIAYQLNVPAAQLTLAIGQNNLTDKELRSRFESYLRDSIAIAGDSGPCLFTVTGVSQYTDSGMNEEFLSINLEVSCPATKTLTVQNTLFFEQSPTQKNVLQVVQGNATQTFTLTPGNDKAVVALDASVGSGMLSTISGFLSMGVHHILSGYDHILFLLGIVLIASRFRPLLKVVTSFTVAHSITLALSVLNIIALSPAITEPLIGLTIAYIGIENLFAKNINRRWLVTFFLGLVHGLGFAGALKAIRIPAVQLIPALASFNLGVEAGQFVILLVLLPFLRVLHRSRKKKPVITAVSIAIAAAGAFLFVSRAFGIVAI